MQTMLNDPKVDKYSMLVEDDKVRVGASSMQGWRSTMEDAHTVILSVPQLGKAATDAAIAGVYDGHCGSKVAQLVASRIGGWITETEQFKTGQWKEMMVQAYLNGDQQLLHQFPLEASGCTAVTLFLVGTTICCANCGDSRAVLCRDGKAIKLSDDHKPSLPQEKHRIVKAGGFVSSTGRINGMLSLSRAFGDFQFKKAGLPPEQQMVTVVPDVVVMGLTDEDEFIVLACDGIWECMSSEDVCTFIHNELADHSDPALACERLMDMCLAPMNQGLGCDNMTVIIVQPKSKLLRRSASVRAAVPAAPIGTAT